MLLSRGTRVVGTGNTREAREELGQLIDLFVVEVLLEELADRAHVPARSSGELGRPFLGELRVGDAPVARARRPLHDPRLLEPREEPRPPGRGEREPAGKVDA